MDPTYLLCPMCGHLFLSTMFDLQSKSVDSPDEAGKNGLPSSQLDPFTHIQVTDIFYEDTVKSSPLETITPTITASAAVVPGLI